LVTAVIAADACVTDTLQIAHEWAGDSQTDVPPRLQFGPSYETWAYLLKRIEEDRMTFLDKLHLGLEVIFGEFPCEQSTINEIHAAKGAFGYALAARRLERKLFGHESHEPEN
jgi:hypothetical protein